MKERDGREMRKKQQDKEMRGGLMTKENRKDKLGLKERGINKGWEEIIIQ